MKKILALTLSALLVLTACASMLVVSAAEGDPVYLIDGSALKADVGNQVHGEYSYTDGFIHLTASDTDPWYWLISNGQNTQVGRYMTIKYKTTCEGMVGGMFASTGAFGEGGVYTSFNFDYPVKTGEWDILLIDLEEKLGDKYDENTNMLNHLRFDFTDGDTASADHWVDIEYIAFFDSESDADAYEHALPVDPESAVEGCYKTFDFTGLTNEEAATMIHSAYDVTYEAGETGVVFTAAAASGDGTDPYFTLKNPGATDHVLGMTGKQARYVLVKYKTEADSKDPMQMALFMNVQGAFQWGHEQSYIEMDIENDGEWHYALFDTINDWGQFDFTLEAFRVDMLHACEAGESAELAQIKMFSTEEWVKNYVVAQAATDVAAKELAVAKGWVECDHAETETIPGIPATETETGLTEGTKCALCGEILVAQVEIPALGVEDETDPVVDETDPVVDDETDPVVDDETDPVEDDSTAADNGDDVESTTAATNDGNGEGNGDESTEADAAGCKGVIASAAALSVVALAAGIVIRKKKD